MGHDRLDALDAALSWVDDEWLVLYCVTGVRSGDTESMFAAVEADFSDGLILNADEAAAAAASRGVRPVRIALSGEWSVLIELDSMLGAKEKGYTALSRGTDAVVVHASEGSGLVRYVRDGEDISTFEPISPSFRYGREPDRFVESMHAAGLLPENDEFAGIGVKVLKFVAAEFGLVLSREVVFDHAWPTAFVPRFRQRGSS
ncbi:DUF6461 domain-containing protein [Amycolatopsis lurida]